MKTEISAREALDYLAKDFDRFAWIDVRSENEFEEGHISGFHSAPILNHLERAIVGITYKQQGNSSAVKLGHDLVKESKTSRILKWKTLIESSQTKTGILTCWRGGQRSKIACEWLKESHQCTLRVIGGYKAMRAELLKMMNTPPQLIVVSGLTGSGKTKFIQKFPTRMIDLEKHAHHRGSTFGMLLSGTQPKQATFENKLLFDFFKNPQETLIEDESVRIGQVQIPLQIKEKMIQSPVVWIDATLEERVQSIALEYVLDPIQKGFPADQIFQKLNQSILLLRKKLGPELTRTISISLKKTFEADPKNSTLHSDWIIPLLEKHYDKLYHYSFSRNSRTVLFRGTQPECKTWLQNRFR